MSQETLAAADRSSGGRFRGCGRARRRLGTLAGLVGSFFLAALVLLGSPQQSNVLTKDDLVRLTKEEIPDELIISMVKAAERVPQLTPEDVIALKRAGVSANVLTAVIQRRTAVLGTPQEKADEQKRRRIRVTASLHPQKRAWWRRGFRTPIEQTGVSWGLQATRWTDRGTLTLSSSPICPQDVYCKKWDDSGAECLEPVAAGSAEWQKSYSCYLADKVTNFGEEYLVFDVHLPEPAADADIHIYYRNLENERLPWFTRSVPESSEDRVPGYIKLRLWGSSDIDLQVHVQLFLSRGGYVQDFRVTECEVANRDEESLRRKLLSGQNQYCNVMEARVSASASE